MFLSIFAFILMGYMSENETQVIAETALEDTTYVEIDTVPQNYYIANGVVRDSLLIYFGTVKVNQNLSEILLKFRMLK